MSIASGVFSCGKLLANGRDDDHSYLSYGGEEGLSRTPPEETELSGRATLFSDLKILPRTSYLRDARRGRSEKHCTSAGRDGRENRNIAQ